MGTTSSRPAAPCPPLPPPPSCGPLIDRYRQMAEANSCFVNPQAAGLCFKRLEKEYPQLFQGFARNEPGVVLNEKRDSIIAVAEPSGQLSVVPGGGIKIPPAPPLPTAIPAAPPLPTSIPAAPPLPEILVSPETRRELQKASNVSSPQQSHVAVGPRLVPVKPQAPDFLADIRKGQKLRSTTQCTMGLVWDPMLHRCIKVDQAAGKPMLSQLQETMRKRREMMGEDELLHAQAGDDHDWS